MHRSKTHQFRPLLSLHLSLHQVPKQLPTFGLPSAVQQMAECTTHTYVLHCQSFALKRPRLFSARVLPISVPPAFIIFASVVLSVEHKENILKNTIFIKPFKKCTRFLNKDTRPTSATSVTTSSSGKIHISTPIKEQFHLLLTAVA